MPDIGAGCSKSEHNDDKDEQLRILKSFIDSHGLPGSSEGITVEERSLFDPSTSFEQHFFSGYNPLAEMCKEDQLQGKSGTVVHTNDADSSDDKYSDCGKILDKMIVEKQEPYKTVVHTGDTDSSDDEYSDCGKIIKKMLVEKQEPYKREEVPTNLTSFWQKRSTSTVSSAVHTETLPSDVYTDSVFGIRMLNRLVSSTLLKEKMQGREVVPLARLKNHVAMGTVSSDWVVAGIVIQKSSLKTSQKGSQYSIWKLSDLKEGLGTFSIFLFRAAASELWKTAEGTVIAVLNPGILENRPKSGDEATLSVDSAQRVLILGTSKDLGVCRATKKDGSRCTMFVNKSRCEFCVYHLRQEYQKCSKRSELNSAGGGGLVNIRKKVLGKNEVFYAGKSFTAVPAKHNVKQQQKDDQRLKSLSSSKRRSDGSVPSTRSGATVASHSPKPLTRDQRDAEILLKLKDGGEASGSAQGSPAESKQCMASTVGLGGYLAGLRALRAIGKLGKPAEEVKSVIPTTQPDDLPMPGNGTSVKKFDAPKLGAGSSSQIDLSIPASKVQKKQAMINAKKWIQKHGPIKKLDPNSVKADKDAKKRKLEEGSGSVVAYPSTSGYQGSGNKPELGHSTGESVPAISKDPCTSSKYQDLMKTSSKHTGLLKVNEELAQDQYFEKLGKKEQLELQMMQLYKIPCVAVQCAKCKYTALGPSELCKSQSHTLKSVKTFKRFFKCGNCTRRIMTLDIVPLQACKNCGSSSWERAPMLKETKGNLLVESLSLRGDEEMFLGSTSEQANLNLMIPD